MTTAWTYDAAAILRETRAGVTYKYIQGPAIDEPLAREDGSGTRTYYHLDALGSIVKMTDATGAVVQTRQYDAWGNLEVGSDQPGYSYTAREWDPETQLYYYRARYYDPKVGRFVSEDPIRFRGGVNFYRYVDNAPQDAVDPFGLQSPPSYPPNPDPFFQAGAGALWSNFNAMVQKNWQGADKYYHCMGHCEAASQGPGGAVASVVIGDLREDLDFWKDLWCRGAMGVSAALRSRGAPSV